MAVEQWTRMKRNILQAPVQNTLTMLFYVIRDIEILIMEHKREHVVFRMAVLPTRLISENT